MARIIRFPGAGGKRAPGKDKGGARKIISFPGAAGGTPGQVRPAGPEGGAKRRVQSFYRLPEAVQQRFDKFEENLDALRPDLESKERAVIALGRTTDSLGLLAARGRVEGAYVRLLRIFVDFHNFASKEPGLWEELGIRGRADLEARIARIAEDLDSHLQAAQSIRQKMQHLTRRK